MNILLTPPLTGTYLRYFPEEQLNRLSALGRLTVNPTGRRLTEPELLPLLDAADPDVILTHWGSVQYTEEILRHAPNLKILAHCAGTVAHTASEAAYERGIHVLSANPVMAKYVAEWVLGVLIGGLRQFPVYDAMMRDGEWRTADLTRSLFGLDIGLVGLGTVGRALLDLLRPFGCHVRVCDPYLPDNALAPWDFARPASFEEVMTCPVVSIHASQTPETYHILNADALSRMPDGGLLINSARGSLVDMDALLPELEAGRLFAVLDVFEREDCPQDARLLACRKNTILQPHTAGLPAGWSMTAAIIDDLERYVRGEPLRLTVSLEQYRHMTQE